MPERTNMGLAFGLQDASSCFPRKYRWLFIVDKIIGDDQGSSVNALPPIKGARPSVSYKEIELEHLSETIYFPGKPDWKPIQLTLYDLKRNKNPIFDWVKLFYDPTSDSNTIKFAVGGFKKNATLELYDGCGQIMETWVFENAWPQSVDFGDLDMSSTEIVTVDITLRYDRAYRKD